MSVPDDCGAGTDACGARMRRLSLHWVQTDVSSSTVTGLLKGGLGALGFGRLAGQAKPAIRDHNTLIVYVLGGLTLHEAREVQEALKSVGRSDVNLLVGGDRLITPRDIVADVWF
eukprot:scaffold2063_cov401-Prasinococcus_capsulatus_cf.AAC.12